MPASIIAPRRFAMTVGSHRITQSNACKMRNATQRDSDQPRLHRGRSGGLRQMCPSQGKQSQDISHISSGQLEILTESIGHYIRNWMSGMCLHNAPNLLGALWRLPHWRNRRRRTLSRNHRSRRTIQFATAVNEETTCWLSSRFCINPNGHQFRFVWLQDPGGAGRRIKNTSNRVSRDCNGNNGY